MGRRGRYAELRKREVLAEWERSGLSPTEFAKRQGVPSNKTLLTWLRESRSQRFLPVQIKAQTPEPAKGRLRLSCGQVLIELDSGVVVHP